MNWPARCRRQCQIVRRFGPPAVLELQQRPSVWLLSGGAVWRTVCVFLPAGPDPLGQPRDQPGQVIGALIGGPVHLVDPEELLFDDLTDKLELAGTGASDPLAENKAVPVISTERVNSQ